MVPQYDDWLLKEFALCLDFEHRLIHTSKLESAKIWHQVKVWLVCFCKCSHIWKWALYQILSFFGWWHDIGRDTQMRCLTRRITKYKKPSVMWHWKIYLEGRDIYDESPVVFVCLSLCLHCKLSLHFPSSCIRRIHRWTVSLQTYRIYPRIHNKLYKWIFN